MEINMTAPKDIEVRRQATIMDRTTLLNKGICILDPKKIMWIQTKQDYDKHVERLENWKNISEEEKWTNKVNLIILFLMNQETTILDIMPEFLNTFVSKGTYIYFGYQKKMYMINKKLIIDVFGVCAKGHVKDPKGQINKIVTLHAL